MDPRENDASSPDSVFLRAIPPGPLDVVGDVHGEIEPLRRLLKALGYDEQGAHADNRTLVFVGDLADRGPDSVAVVLLVRELCRRGRALCIAGNHELNLLRSEVKDGNGWAYADNHDRKKGKYPHSRDARADERDLILDFFADLPIALYREDLRIVHACWDDEALSQIVQLGARQLGAAFDHFEARTTRQLAELGLTGKSRAEQQAHDLRNPAKKPLLLDASARADELRQMGNPVRIMTSGVERAAASPFFSSGQWRMVDRIAWWKEYANDTPVVVGHYWRWPTKVDRSLFEKDGPDLFADARPADWLGLKRNVFCVDFSIGRRYRERELGFPEGSCARLGALRWPERELVFDTGHRETTE